MYTQPPKARSQTQLNLKMKCLLRLLLFTSYVYRMHTNSAPGYYFQARHLGGLVIEFSARDLLLEKVFYFDGKKLWLGVLYYQGRHSNQCHRAMALVVFLPRPESQYIYWVPRKITLKSPKWHWLILSPIGANVYYLQ